MELVQGAAGAQVRSVLEPWSDPDPAWDAVGACGGSGLAVALLAQAAERNPAPLVIAAGDAVSRGLPTAARATVASRGPLTGRLAEGQVGGDLGPRLAAVADALVISGQLDPSGEPLVLVIESGGGVRLELAEELGGARPADVAAHLRARLGPCAVLRLGPAGAAQVPFASLASGGDEPSFVGRGGLGAALGALGLAAVAVRAEPGAPAADPRALDLLRALGRSPRLAMRAGAGTTELWHALAARGELISGPEGARLDPEAGARLVSEARAAGLGRHGCRGCPTPCGWTFERSGGGTQRAHFGAAQAVGPALGLEHLDDSLRLLGACDAVGVDAKEMGAALALWIRAAERGLRPGPSGRGDVALLEAWIGETARCEGEGARLAQGAAALSRELGLEPESPMAGGQAVRAGVAGDAALLGQCVSGGGSDPMRSFAFLAEEADPERIASLVGRDDPTPGELVAWHEALVAAVDAVGFCAFSTAGLLADGVCDTDALAEWILPLAWPATEGTSGQRLLAGGAAIVLARRQLDGRWGAPADRDRPAAAAASLDRPGLLDAYRAARGIGADGLPLDEVWSAVGTSRLAEPWRVLERAAIDLAPSSGLRVDAERPMARGSLHLRAVGPLGDAIGGDLELQLDLPASPRELLAALVEARPAARSYLGDPGSALVGLWRGGRRMGLNDRLADGDQVDLVLVIAGG
ncbi:aldehyde ferredoxin oxidoreductase N-terminal domain-containing protein [Engelhardtia mirabilis]|uniref:Putative oxidoreductase n=1 Tax=Engelhardtia mirabilis TaxID=2528011 RepID=A0A518BPQ1_9BACT|nr:putative oxidoreductase [Planctomycetes bacterium Pla133]QDV03288.1 putative oxidoreductase [Planctomycetes bacterium Pla86]